MPRYEREIGQGEVTCLACGWVGYAVSRAEVEGKPLDRFRCRGCGGWGPYRPALAEDCPDGATTLPVLWELE